MSYYRQSTIVFGLILPLLGMGLLTGAGFVMYSKVQGSMANKQQQLNQFELSHRESELMEKKLQDQRKFLQQWNRLLEEESASAVNKKLGALAKVLPSKEFQKSGFDRTPGASGLATNNPQHSSQIRVAFRGTYRTMQRAFLELETKLPQLQLQDLRITPTSAQGQGGQFSLLNFQASYTAWEN